MNHNDAAAAYRNATFDNAPPIKILHMLFEGAIRFLKHAREQPPGSEEYRKYLRRADEIVTELRTSLDHEPSPELSANLENLYVFMTGELARAHVEGEVEAIDPCIGILETLLEGWKQAQVQLSGGQ